MQVPMSISFRGMDTDAALEARVRESAKKLERFHERITSCDVVIEQPHKSHKTGNLYHVRIDIRVPGKEIVVQRQPGQHHEHEEIGTVIKDAFDAARRQLQDWIRMQRGDVKHHEATS